VEVPPGVHDLKSTLKSITRQTERTIIRQALEASGNNRTKAAEAIGLSRRALLMKIKEYDL
jgi:two-component system response regulator AtoC